MTNHWIDIQHSDVIIIIGSNAAENHTIGMKYVNKALEKGAKLISIDPRYTRSSSLSDIYAPMRSGTDIAFIGGIINHALQNGKVHRDYIVDATNGSFLINPGFGFRDGLFTGYNEAKRDYNKSTWGYQLDGRGNPRQDKSLNNPNCVYQIMKKHYSRYTPDVVSGITGCPKDLFLKVAELYTSTSAPDRVGTIMYAMGTTQHTVGTQNIRTYAMLQLLMGNVGKAGGGINALRGESNVQGSTDMCLLFHILPGYLKTPQPKDRDLATYIKNYTPVSNDKKSANWWSNTNKYIVSLLKAWWNDHATADKEGGFCYNYLPKREGWMDHITLFEQMYVGQFEGFILWGQNPVVGGPNVQKEKKALEKLKWMVAVDLWETETAAFWKAPGTDPAKIKTEVFLLPAASSMEKEGSVTNSGRWAQWRYAAIQPGDPGWHGDARPDLWIVDAIFKGVRNEYRKNKGNFPDPILNLFWDYGTGDGTDPHKEPDVHQVAREINGYFTRDTKIKGKLFKKGTQAPSFGFLQADGSTMSGNWLMSGSYVEWSSNEGKKTDAHYVNNSAGQFSNRLAKRIAEKNEPKARKLIARGRAEGLNLNWSWTWPVNRRIIYNRASVDNNGIPYDKDKWVISWNSSLKGGKGAFEGDVPDGGWAPGTKYPFIMLPEGHARLFAKGLRDGPLPEHYEPVESPFGKANPMPGNSIAFNPVILQYFKGTKLQCELNKIGECDVYPIVCTTYRLSEHWQAGAMTRNQPWLSELMPDFFVEMSKELAEKIKVKNGEKVKLNSARGSVVAYALVTARFKPFHLKDSKGKDMVVHQVGIPWHFGYQGISKGDTANFLTPHVGDANTNIPEYKAFLCNVVKA